MKTCSQTAAEIVRHGIKAHVPDMDICENEKKIDLWGCKGGRHRYTLLKLKGEPFNWNVFDGLSHDSLQWMLEAEGILQDALHI